MLLQYNTNLERFANWESHDPGTSFENDMIRILKDCKMNHIDNLWKKKKHGAHP